MWWFSEVGWRAAPRRVEPVVDTNPPRGFGRLGACDELQPVLASKVAVCLAVDPLSRGGWRRQFLEFPPLAPDPRQAPPENPLDTFEVSSRRREHRQSPIRLDENANGPLSS